RIDVLQQVSPFRRAVAPEQFAAMRAVIRSEENDVSRLAAIVRRTAFGGFKASDNRILRVGADRSGIDVRHLFRAGFGAISSPEFRSVQAIIRAEKDEVIVANKI